MKNEEGKCRVCGREAHVKVEIHSKYFEIVRTYRFCWRHAHLAEKLIRPGLDHFCSDDGEKVPEKGMALAKWRSTTCYWCGKPVPIKGSRKVRRMWVHKGKCWRMSR